MTFDWERMKPLIQELKCVRKFTSAQILDAIEQTYNVRPWYEFTLLCFHLLPFPTVTLKLLENIEMIFFADLISPNIYSLRALKYRISGWGFTNRDGGSTSRALGTFTDSGNRALGMFTNALGIVFRKLIYFYFFLLICDRL
jgi:hypothetical protein